MKYSPLFSATTALFVLSLSAVAEEGFTDPDAAGPDLAVQGEYEGKESGAQVIALGDGKFHVVGWENGLPGKVEDANKRVELSGQRVGERIVFEGDGWKGAIENGKLTGTSDEGAEFELKRVERTSLTINFIVDVFFGVRTVVDQPA